MVRNTTIDKKTGLQSVSAIIDARRTALLVMSLDLMIVCQLPIAPHYRRLLRHTPYPFCKQPRGRPCNSWLKPFSHSHIPIKEHWDAAVRRGHGALVQRSSLDTRH